MKTTLLSLTLLCFLAVTAQAQTADEVVKKALEARGGEERIKAVKSERVSGHISFGHGVEGAFVVELKRPNKMHMEISVEGQRIVRVYDGKSAGWMINPFAENKDVQPLSAEELKSINDESDFDGPLVDYKAKGNHIELAGKETLEGKPVYRLKLTNKNGDVRFYLFDAASFMLVKWEGNRKSAGQDLPWESYFSDFREVRGLKFAFQIDQGSPNSDIKQTLTAEKVEIDPQLDESRFSKPAAADASGDPPASKPPSADPLGAHAQSRE